MRSTRTVDRAFARRGTCLAKEALLRASLARIPVGTTPVGISFGKAITFSCAVVVVNETLCALAADGWAMMQVMPTLVGGNDANQRTIQR